jgi:hypothetical protein
MTDRLRLIDSDLEAVTWDAYKSDDGTWQVTGAWRAGDKSGTTRWGFDLPSRTVTPSDAATMDFAEGTRLVRVVPEVPVGGPPTPVHHQSRPVSMLRDPEDAYATGPVEGSEHFQSSVVGEHDDDVLDHLTDDLSHLEMADDTHVRDVHPADDVPMAHLSVTQESDSALLDEVAEHDTVVLSREGDLAGGLTGEDADPRAKVPAWEDIVFGVRRHR